MKRFLLKYGAAGAALVGLAQAAHAQVTTYATPAAALAGLGDTATDMAPTLYGLAVVATGIMIGLAWIKKGKSAAR